MGQEDILELHINQHSLQYAFDLLGKNCERHISIFSVTGHSYYPPYRTLLGRLK